MMTGVLGLFLWELQHGTDLAVARTMAVNALVAAEMFYLVNSRSTFASVLNWQGLTGNRTILLAIAACIPLQLAYTYLPLFQTLFSSADLGLQDWLKVIAAGLLVFFGAELEKALMRRTRFSAVTAHEQR
jgi:magnesium-transporting ATPase (P-type)